MSLLLRSKKRAEYVEVREQILAAGDRTYGMANMTPVEEYVLSRSIALDSDAGSEDV